MRSELINIVAGVLGVVLITSSGVKASNALQSGQVVRASADETGEFARIVLDRYCGTCHNDRLKTAGFSLDAVDLSRIDTHPEQWEQVVLSFLQ